MKTLGNLAIFKNLKEIVNPEHNALVLWDCQSGLVDYIFNKEVVSEHLSIPSNLLQLLTGITALVKTLPLTSRRSI